MAKKTLKQRNLEILQEAGWTVDANSRVSRYTVLTKPGKSFRYFLGNAGAVRRGKTVTGSISVKLKANELVKRPITKTQERSSQESPTVTLSPGFAKAIVAAENFIDQHVDRLTFVLSEDGSEIERFPTIAAAKQYLQDTWGEGKPLEWKRAKDGQRRLICEQFTIHAEPKEGKQGADPTSPISAKPSATAPTSNDSSTTSATSMIATSAASQSNSVPAPMPSSAPATPANQPTSLSVQIAEASRPDTTPHVEVQALAGTGKTTTCIEGLKEVKGIKSGLTPSDQQAEVWKQLCGGKRTSIRISSFSRKITSELEKRLTSSGLDKMGVEAKGIHSLGYSAVRQRFGRCSADKAKWVVVDMAAEMLGINLKDAKGTPKAEQAWAIDELVSLCKQTLTDPTPENLDQLASHYDVELTDGKADVYSLVPAVLERCRIPTKGQITFDDMIWLPIVHSLPIHKVDLQVIDESQDLNRMQQELMYRAGHRIVFVGDKHQAIFGFAGADAISMARMASHLLSQPRGCVTLPLTMTRRCGRAIVKEAQRYVPEYEAHPSNCEGSILDAYYEGGKAKQYRALVKPGDFVLCRCNAPLASQCFKFLKEGRKAIILGKKIGEGLVALVNKSKRRDVPGLISWLDDWASKETANEQAKKHPSEVRIETINDKRDCLVCFCEGLSDSSEVLAKINAIFTDDPDSNGVILSSIHKSKGLEAQRVFLLRPKGVGPRLDKMQEWEIQQESNLSYVAITRAIESLTYVS